MRSECKTDFYRYSELCVAVVAYVANALLCYLILRHTPRELRVYSRVLLLACVVDFLYITANFVLEAHVVVYGGNFYFVFNGFIFSTEPYIGLVFALISLFTGYLLIVWVTVPFVFRYALISKNKVLNNWQLFGLVVFAIFGGMTVPTACYFCYCDQMERSETDQNLYEALPCVFNAQVVAFSTVNITFRDAFPVIVASVAVTYNYAVVLFCSIGVWRKMQDAPLYVSPKLQSMNRQLGRMLVAQAISPIMLVGAPLTAMFVVIYEKTVDAPMLMLVTSMLSWITLVNPLSTIHFVKAYRYKLLAFVGRRSRIEPMGTSQNDTAIYGVTAGQEFNWRRLTR